MIRRRRRRSPTARSPDPFTHRFKPAAITIRPAAAHRSMDKVCKRSEFCVFMLDKMLLKVENTLLRSHRQRETTGIKKLYNSFFVMF